MENPVKLGEAGEAAGGRNICNLVFRIEQQELTVADAYQVDVLGNGIAGDFLKLMGQIKGIHVDAFGKFLQGEVVHVMGMDIIGYGIYSFGQTILRVLCLVDIAVLEVLQVIQKLGKKAVYHELIGAGHFLGAGLVGQRYDFIQNPNQNLLLGIRKTEDRYGLMKRR